MNTKFGYIERFTRTDGGKMLRIIYGDQSKPTQKEFFEPDWLTNISQKAEKYNKLLNLSMQEKEWKLDNAFEEVLEEKK
jgi:ribosomal protein L25 (general stress protein Ctc)